MCIRYKDSSTPYVSDISTTGHEEKMYVEIENKLKVKRGE